MVDYHLFKRIAACSHDLVEFWKIIKKGQNRNP